MRNFSIVYSLILGFLVSIGETLVGKTDVMSALMELMSQGGCMVSSTGQEAERTSQHRLCDLKQAVRSDFLLPHL